MKRYFIEDWAGNRLNEHGTFADFEDAWEYIREKFPNEEIWEALYVTAEEVQL